MVDDGKSTIYMITRIPTPIYITSLLHFSLRKFTHPIHLDNESTSLLTLSSKSPLEMSVQLLFMVNVHRSHMHCGEWLVTTLSIALGLTNHLTNHLINTIPNP